MNPVAVLECTYCCGTVHESQIEDFRHLCKEQGLKSVHFDSKTNGVRRKVYTNASEQEVVMGLIATFDTEPINLPFIPGTWAVGVTTIPERADMMRAVEDRILSQLTVDDIILVHNDDIPEVRYGAAGNWHITLTMLYTVRPWAQYYAILQDDIIAVRDLFTYITANPFPLKGYANLYTSLENDDLIAGKTWISEEPITRRGWLPAFRTRSGMQTGRGALALVFTNEGVETLLSSPHMIRKKRDGLRRKTSIDGTIVEAMNAVGWTEYIHNPSLVQHVGLESSIGNPTRPVAATFPGEDFDAMSLLEIPHAAPTND